MAFLKRKRVVVDDPHPYLSGNFSPVENTNPLTPCAYTGQLPSSLANGQYVRNGANPLLNEDLGRDAHWFDGDGMLTGVLFKELPDGTVEPQFVNQWIETDVYKAGRELLAKPTKRWWSLGGKRRPIPPSIATLTNPAAGLFTIIWAVLRTMWIVFVSHILSARTKIKRISVANTGIYYHDGRALATCESGPPMHVNLPDLTTESWYNGAMAKGLAQEEEFGGNGLLSFIREYTTGHPKVDTETGELILFHNTFIKPYVQYSIVQPSNTTRTSSTRNVTVPGVTSPKLMHDFGVSRTHTIILDLPLSLDPLNLAKGKPIVGFDTSQPSRFGVFPRHNPQAITWFEHDPCIIFHTACTWDELDAAGHVVAVCMLACRMTNESVVFTAGNINIPARNSSKPAWSSANTDEASNELKRRRRISLSAKRANSTDEKTPLLHAFDDAPALESNLSDNNVDPIVDAASLDQCRLHYYRFPLPTTSIPTSPLRPSHSFPLSPLPLEFPTTAPGRSLHKAQYIYACSTSAANFSSALGKAAKIDVLAKIDAPSLVARGRARSRGLSGECVDARTGAEILAAQLNGAEEQDDDAIKLFKFPPGVYGQEPRFVPAENARSEDDGHLLFFTFDEAQLRADGSVPQGAVSELWVLDARNMRDVVARVRCTQRVPYGLHGEWFDKGMVAGQRVMEGSEEEEEIQE